jgi:NADPH:quinone reductase-like Zn-dependent oxidoreductase
MPLACRLFAFGENPPAVRVEEIPTPTPAPGEVVIRMLAAPINPADLNVIEGSYGQLPPLPATIGNEGCGEILALGAGVENLRIGQKVLPLAFGTWTRELLLPAENAIPLPDDIDIRQAAMLAHNGVSGAFICMFAVLRVYIQPKKVQASRMSTCAHGTDSSQRATHAPSFTSNRGQGRP